MNDAQRVQEIYTHLRKMSVTWKTFEKNLAAGKYPDPLKTEGGKVKALLDDIGNTSPTPPPVAPSLWDGPGLFTDETASLGRADYFANLLGPNRWVAQQAQNGDAAFKPVDLTAWKSKGFKVGVWGVTYDPAKFARDGAALAARANDLNGDGTNIKADLLIIDAEECLKNTDPTPLIQALSAFSGPKALSTYGGASGTNVFPMRWDFFFNAGYHLLLQAYGQITPEYEPPACIAHLKRWCAAFSYSYAKARAMTHLTAYTSMSASDIHIPMNASQLVTLHQQAGSHGDDSLFMPEYEFNFAGLKPLFT